MQLSLVGAKKAFIYGTEKYGAKTNLNTSGRRLDYHRLQSSLEFLSKFDGCLWHVRDRYSEYLEKVIGSSQFLDLTTLCD
jgi:hypothetical protein